MEPRTNTSRPLLSRASRAIRAPWVLMRRTSPSRPNAASLKRLAPKVLVSMASAPTAMYSVCTDCTRRGWVRLRASKQGSSSTPRA